MSQSLAEFVYAHMVSSSYLDGRHLSEKHLADLCEVARRAEKVFMFGRSPGEEDTEKLSMSTKSGENPLLPPIQKV